MYTAHPDEVRADFLRFYDILDWRSLGVVAAGSLFAAMIRQPESWTHRALNPYWRWGDPGVHAAMYAGDMARLLVWQNTKEGQKGRNQPECVARPELPSFENPDEYEAVSIERLDALLGL